MSQNQTQTTYIPKFAFPFKDVNNINTYNEKLSSTPKGNYLFTRHGLWHGAPHFYGTNFDSKIQVIADGELVAYRLNSKYLKNSDAQEGKGAYSTGFFLVRHKIEYPTNNKLIFFSLYMHTAKKDAYNIIQTQSNQTNQSNTTNYYTVKKGDTLGKIAKVHNTTVDKLRQDNNIADVNKIREGHVLIIKPFPSSQPTQNTPPPQNNPNSNPNFIVENPLFNKVVVLPTPIKIKAGEVIGLMGEYNQQKESDNKVLHLEVFANEEFKTFVQTAQRGDKNLPQSFSWARVIEIDSKDNVSIFEDLEDSVLPLDKDQTDDEIKINKSFRDLFNLIDKDHQNGIQPQEIEKAAEDIEIKKVTNNYIVKHSSEWDKTENMAEKLYKIMDKNQDKIDDVESLKKHYENEKKRIYNLSFFEECKDKIEGFPKDDKVYVMNPVGLVNQFNKKCLITKEMLIAMGCTEASNNQLLIDALNKYCKEYEINNCLRVAHFLSQAAHESGGFITQTEDEHYRESVALQNSCYLAYRNTSIGRNIQLTPRKDKHGNVQKDSNGNIIYNCKQPEYFNCKYANKNGNGDFTSRDGYKYRGRGIMQITGRETYRNYKNDHTQRNPNDIKDFEANPELVISSKEYEVASGCSYWFNKTRANKNLNLWADEGSSDEVVLKVSAVVNGFYDKNEEQYNKFSTSEKAKYLKVEDDLYLKIPNGYDEPNKPFSRLPLFHKLKNHMGL